MNLFVQNKPYTINNSTVYLVNIPLNKIIAQTNKVKEYAEKNNIQLTDNFEKIPYGGVYFEVKNDDLLRDVVLVNETIRTDVKFENGKLKDIGRPYFGNHFSDYLDLVSQADHEKLLNDVKEFRDSCLHDLNDMNDDQYLEMIEKLLKKKDNIEQTIYSLRLNTLRNFTIFLAKELSKSHQKKWQDIISLIQSNQSTKTQDKKDKKTETLKNKLTNK